MALSEQQKQQKASTYIQNKKLKKIIVVCTYIYLFTFMEGEPIYILRFAWFCVICKLEWALLCRLQLGKDIKRYGNICIFEQSCNPYKTDETYARENGAQGNLLS